MDWNNVCAIYFFDIISHHPHGWCGLKCFDNISTSTWISSPPTRVVWIEIINDGTLSKVSMSPPTRVVWIEIIGDINAVFGNTVTTHTGGVDWNRSTRRRTYKARLVTTHTGGVDWNRTEPSLQIANEVTTHTGGVDWNIMSNKAKREKRLVTTHTGGVDWNI